MTHLQLKNKTIIVTGAPIYRANLVLELLRTKEPMCVVGIDNLNDYYDVFY